MSKWYILDENDNPVITTDRGLVEEFLGSKRKIVAQTEHQGYWISTVFLSLDHSFIPNGFVPKISKPVLWETMIFEQGDTGKETYQKRYTSYEDAVKGHQDAIDWLDEQIKHGELVANERVMTEEEQESLRIKRREELHNIVKKLGINNDS